MIEETTETTATVEAEAAPKKRSRKAVKKAVPKKAKARKAKAKTKNGGRALKLNTERKDTIAAALRIRENSPRAKVVEHLAKHKGKMFSADQIAKLVDWDRRNVQQFMTVRIPYKSAKYRLGYKVLSDGEGNYGLDIK